MSKSLESITPPEITSIPRGLDVSQRGLDRAMLEAAEPDLKKYFKQISHYEFYGNLGIVLDLEVSETEEPKNEKRQRGYDFWHIDDIFTDEIMQAMSDPNVPKLTRDEVKEALDIDINDYLEGVAIADITEAGIVHYPSDINYVFNPENIVSPQRFMQQTGTRLSQQEIKDMQASMPSYALFPPTWATQEMFHTPVGQKVLKGAGYNMQAHKLRTMNWQVGASTPMPMNTPQGTVYTDFQEGSTANYYVSSAQVAKKLSALAENLGKAECALFWKATEKAFRIVGREEAGHRTYIRKTRLAALDRGDLEVRSYMYGEWAKAIIRTDRKGHPSVPMPGLFIENFTRGSIMAERAQLYGRIGALSSISNTLNASQLDNPKDLDSAGSEAVERLQKHKELVDAELKKLREKSAQN